MALGSYVFLSQMNVIFRKQNGARCQAINILLTNGRKFVLWLNVFHEVSRNIERD